MSFSKGLTSTGFSEFLLCLLLPKKLPATPHNLHARKAYLGGGAVAEPVLLHHFLGEVKGLVSGVQRREGLGRIPDSVIRSLMNEPKS